MKFRRFNNQILSIFWPGSNQILIINFKLSFIPRIILMIGKCHICKQDSRGMSYIDILLNSKERTVLICEECKETVFSWKDYAQNASPQESAGLQMRRTPKPQVKSVENKTISTCMINIILRYQSYKSKI